MSYKMRGVLFCFVFLLNGVSAYVLVTSRPAYMLMAPLMQNVDDIVLLTNNQCCSHSYTMKFSDIQKVLDAKMMVWMGKAHEPVFEQLVLKSQNLFTVFNQSNSFEWLSPRRMMTYVRLLSDQLIKTYPEKEDFVRANSDEFLKTLGRLDAVVTQSKNKLSRSFVTTYSFLDAFAQDYGIDVKFSLGKNPYHTLSLTQKHRLKECPWVTLLADKHLSRTSEYESIYLDTEAAEILLDENAYEIFIAKILDDIVKCCQRQVGEKYEN